MDLITNHSRQPDIQQLIGSKITDLRFDGLNDLKAVLGNSHCSNDEVMQLFAKNLNYVINLFDELEVAKEVYSEKLSNLVDAFIAYKDEEGSWENLNTTYDAVVELVVKAGDIKQGTLHALKQNGYVGIFASRFVAKDYKGDPVVRLNGRHDLNHINQLVEVGKGTFHSAFKINYKSIRKVNGELVDEVFKTIDMNSTEASNRIRGALGIKKGDELLLNRNIAVRIVLDVIAEQYERVYKKPFPFKDMVPHAEMAYINGELGLSMTKQPGRPGFGFSLKELSQSSDLKDMFDFSQILAYLVLQHDNHDRNIMVETTDGNSTLSLIDFDFAFGEIIQDTDSFHKVMNVIITNNPDFEQSVYRSVCNDFYMRGQDCPPKNSDDYKSRWYPQFSEKALIERKQYLNRGIPQVWSMSQDIKDIVSSIDSDIMNNRLKNILPEASVYALSKRMNDIRESANKVEGNMINENTSSYAYVLKSICFPVPESKLQCNSLMSINMTDNKMYKFIKDYLYSAKSESAKNVLGLFFSNYMDYLDFRQESEGWEICRYHLMLACERIYLKDKDKLKDFKKEDICELVRKEFAMDEFSNWIQEDCHTLFEEVIKPYYIAVRKVLIGNNTQYDSLFMNEMTNAENVLVETVQTKFKKDFDSIIKEMVENAFPSEEQEINEY